MRIWPSRQMLTVSLLRARSSYSFRTARRMERSTESRKVPFSRTLLGCMGELLQPLQKGVVEDRGLLPIPLGQDAGLISRILKDTPAVGQRSIEVDEIGRPTV